MIKKSYEFQWQFEAPEAILACSILNCNEKSYLVFGGHDRNLYLMDHNRQIVDSIEFDGWIRCIDTRDIDGDGCDEILSGTGDGNCLVIKVNLEEEKLQGIKHYLTNGKILCCVAGDITRNGQYELIFGGDNNKLIIFKNLSSETPQFIQHYESWVTACDIGLLKLSILQKPIICLIIGTENGLLQLLHIEDENLRIFWHDYLGSKINDIKIGDVNNNGFNEIITCSDDSKIRIYNSEGKVLSSIIIPETRPLSLLVNDIDGDNANEIIAGCADGSLCIYQNNELNSLNFKLKWSAKVKSSIQDISSIAISKESIRQIIFGGYDRTIRNIVDYEWGEKKKIEIPEKITLPKVKISEKKEIKPVPTNLENHIKTLLDKQKILNIDNLIEKLNRIGYSLKDINEKMNQLQKKNKLITKKEKLDVWYYINEQEELEQKKLVSSEKPVLTEKGNQKERFYEKGSKRKSEEELVAKGENEEELKLSPKELILKTLEQKDNISSKSDLIELTSQKGFSEDIIREEIDNLNDQNIITYSRSKPQGWTLVSDLDSREEIKEKMEDIKDKKNKIESDIISLFEDKEIINTKSELIDLVVSMGYKRGLVEDTIEDLNEREIISYSRSKPRGWTLKFEKLQ